MIQMLKQIARDKGLLVFNHWQFLEESHAINGFDGKGHMNFRAKSTIATHDLAVSQVVEFWAAIRMVAHESYRSGGYASRRYEENINQNYVPFLDDGALLHGTAEPLSLALAKGATRWAIQRQPMRAIVAQQDLFTTTISSTWSAAGKPNQKKIQERCDERGGTYATFAQHRPLAYNVPPFATIHKVLDDYTTSIDASLYNRHAVFGDMNTGKDEQREANKLLHMIRANQIQILPQAAPEAE